MNFQLFTKFYRQSIRLSLIIILLVTAFANFVSAQDENGQYPQQPYYPNYNPQYNQNQPDENYSAKTPFKLEIARIEATVIRAGEQPLPLSQVPRLNKGDALKIRIANEAVNGIMPHQSNWDWTLLIAYINPSKNTNSPESVSQEVRLRDIGWYNDVFFTVPFDSQPMIFLYPKPKYRSKILELITKRPDDIREMGEKVLEISSAYGHISQFLNQVQFMMAQPNYTNGLLEQSIEGAARSFGIQMPSCWRNSSSYGGYSNYGNSTTYDPSGAYGGYSGYSSSSYNNLTARAHCLSRSVRIDDLNFSVGKMLQQGGLVVLNELRKAHPEISKWIALVAVAVDFFMKITRKSAIRIIPAVVSTPENPILVQSGYSNRSFYGQSNYGQSSYTPSYTPKSNFAQMNPSDANKVSLLANYQPTDRDFVTVYAYVPHKWQAEPDPKITSLYVPQPAVPCLHTGKNILRNMDLRVEWLSDTFTRDFKFILSDKQNWSKEFNMRKNLGLNAWELDITKEDLATLPKNVQFEAKITGKRGFTEIESPKFQIPISNGGEWEASIKRISLQKSLLTVKNISGDARCSQNVLYKPVKGEQVLYPVARDNNILKISVDQKELSFEVDAMSSRNDSVQIQLFGGEVLTAKFRP